MSALLERAATLDPQRAADLAKNDAVMRVAQLLYTDEAGARAHLESTDVQWPTAARNGLMATGFPELLEAERAYRRIWS